ncbi:MAG: ABC transporter ATP-binding protein [Terriglobales bacterium]
MLEVRNLSKRYGHFHAVKRISFNASDGEVVGFLGPNGAGKTTTMRMITGYLPVSEGEVTVDGIKLRSGALEAKRRIGYLPELPPIYPELTVDEYLQFVGRLRGIKSSQRKDAVERACKKTALSEVRSRVLGHLSKGYRQRVGIAQAILHDPPLLILDEPTAGLDPRQILETRQLIAELAGKHTIILSTHILSEAAKTCHRVVVINKGELVAEDTPENLTRRLKPTDTLSVQVRGPADAISAALRSVPGVLEVDAPQQRGGIGTWQVEANGMPVREAIARRVVENGWGLVELRPLELSLEEIFLSLTAGKPQPAALAAGTAPRSLPPAPEAVQKGPQL